MNKNEQTIEQAKELIKKYTDKKFSVPLAKEKAKEECDILIGGIKQVKGWQHSLSKQMDLLTEIKYYIDEQ